MRVYLETNSQVTVQLLSKLVHRHQPLFHLVSRGHDLLRRDWSMQFRHIFREANRVADFLASFAFSFPLGRHILGEPPDVVSVFLVSDRLGQTTRRLVTE